MNREAHKEIKRAIKATKSAKEIIESSMFPQVCIAEGALESALRALEWADDVLPPWETE